LKESRPSRSSAPFSRTPSEIMGHRIIKSSLKHPCLRFIAAAKSNWTRSTFTSAYSRADSTRQIRRAAAGLGGRRIQQTECTSNNRRVYIEKKRTHPVTFSCDTFDRSNAALFFSLFVGSTGALDDQAGELERDPDWRSMTLGVRMRRQTVPRIECRSHSRPLRSGTSVTAREGAKPAERRSRGRPATIAIPQSLSDAGKGRGGRKSRRPSAVRSVLQKRAE
jgi:hypothetical protein